MKIGEKIYYCEKIVGEVEEYKAPIEIQTRFNFFTIMPNRSYADIQIYGKDIIKRYTAYANYKIWGEQFKEGDRLYIDNLKPNANEEYGKNANAIIDGVSYDNLFVKLSIKKLV